MSASNLRLGIQTRSGGHKTQKKMCTNSKTLDDVRNRNKVAMKFIFGDCVKSFRTQCYHVEYQQLYNFWYNFILQ